MLEQLIKNVKELPHGIYSYKINDGEIQINIKYGPMEKKCSIKLNNKELYNLKISDFGNIKINIYFPKEKYNYSFIKTHDLIKDNQFTKINNNELFYYFKENECLKKYSSPNKDAKEYYFTNNIFYTKTDDKNYLGYDLKDDKLFVFIHNDNKTIANQNVLDDCVKIPFKDYEELAKKINERKRKLHKDLQEIIKYNDLKVLYEEKPSDLLPEQVEIGTIIEDSKVYLEMQSKINIFDNGYLKEINEFIEDLIKNPDKAEVNSLQTYILDNDINNINALKEIQNRIKSIIKTKTKTLKKNSKTNK